MREAWQNTWGVLAGVPTDGRHRPGRMSTNTGVKLIQQREPGKSYQVHLEVFEGPLDLLLHLIEKQELDITSVSLASVTDQYLDYISHVQRISAENLASFLVVAAKLLLIKSRALLPTPREPDAEEEDVGEELARQLRAYRRFKELAKQLKEREAEGYRTYLRLAPLPRLEKALDLSEVTLEQLLVAVREALSLQPEAGPVSEVVAPIVISITDKIHDIEGMLAGEGSFSFNRLLQQVHSRGEIIVIFLAMLELIKAGRARVKQTTLFGEIHISRPENPSSLAPPPSPQQ